MFKGIFEKSKVSSHDRKQNGLIRKTLNNSGRLWAFGNNAEGQLGIGREHETVNKPFEVQIDLEDPMIAIASGQNLVFFSSFQTTYQTLRF